MPDPSPDAGAAGDPKVTRDQFARQVIETVRSRFPLVKIARANAPFSMRLNGHVASLENLYRTVRLRPADATRQVERWAVELLRASEGTPDRGADFPDISDRILPILVGRGGEEAAARELITQPLVADLAVGYVIDGDRTIAYIPKIALDRWKIDVDELHDVALANLTNRSEQMAAHAATDETGEVSLVLFQTGDGYDASRLLLPGLHKRLREHLGSPFAAAVPNRDILLCFREDEPTVRNLRGQIATDFRTMPHQITDALLLVTADGIAPLAPVGEEL